MTARDETPASCLSYLLYLTAIREHTMVRARAYVVGLDIGVADSGEAWGWLHEQLSARGGG